MRKFILLLTLAFLISPAYAQEAKPTPNPPAAYEMPKKPEREPQTADEFYEAARWVHFNDSDYDAAVKMLGQAIALEPDFTDAYRLRGIYESQRKNCKAAIADFTTVIEQYPDAPNTYQDRAECKIALKDLSGALLDFDMSVSLLAAKNLVQYNAFFKRGKLKYVLKDYDGAIEDFNNAAKRVVENGDATFYRALTRMKKGDDAGAIADFKILSDYYLKVTEKVRIDFPDQYTEPKDYPAGENPLATLKKPKVPAESISNGGIEGISNGGIASSSTFGAGVSCKGCPKTEFANFEDKINPDNWFFNQKKNYLRVMMSDDAEVVYYLSGNLHERLGDEQAAIEDFTGAIIAKRYGNAPLYFRRGKLLLQIGKYEPAVRDFSWAIAQRRVVPDDYLERGIAILMLKHDALAQKDFAMYLKLNPNGKPVLDKRIAEAKVKIAENARQPQ